MPKVAIVTPVFNHLEITRKYVESWRASRYPARHLIIVDDGSTDGTGEWLRRNAPEVRVVTGNGSLWWAASTNAGIRDAFENLQPDYILTLNNDVRLSDGYLEELVEVAREGKGRRIVGSAIYHDEDPQRVWAMGAYSNPSEGLLFELNLSGLQQSWLPDLPRALPVDACPGAGVLVPAKAFDEIGLYNSRFYPQYHADFEFAFRAGKAGYEIVCATRAKIYNMAGHSVSLSHSSGIASLFSKRSARYLPALAHFLAHYVPSNSDRIKCVASTFPKLGAPQRGVHQLIESVEQLKDRAKERLR